MSKDVFDNELDDYLADENNDCLQCGSEAKPGGAFCSEKCMRYYNE